MARFAGFTSNVERNVFDDTNATHLSLAYCPIMSHFQSQNNDITWRASGLVVQQNITGSAVMWNADPSIGYHFTIDATINGVSSTWTLSD